MTQTIKTKSREDPITHIVTTEFFYKKEKILEKEFESYQESINYSNVWALGFRAAEGIFK